GKSKLDHVREMLEHSLTHKQLLFRTVLMDSWYATKEMMLHIESLKKIYYCPLKSNRLVDDSGTRYGYRCVDTLEWNEQTLEKGKIVKVRGFPAEHRLKLFRIAVSTQRTEWIVTNDLTQDSSQASREECSLRWKIEQFHREAKQLTGLEKCQCRKARIQRNHIACAILVWVRLAEIARKSQCTLYKVKHGLLDDFLCQQLKNPSIRMRLA
ncbi:transposase, partial [Undibacterium rugosum]